MHTTIRTFRPEDYDAAFELWKATPGIGLSSADERDAILSFLARNPGMSYVASDGDRLVGTILCGHDGRRGLIHHLVSAVTVRRQGAAQRLLAAGMESFRRAGIQKAHLFVFQSNDEAIAFWRAVGAQYRSELALYSIAVSRDGGEG
ncbi:MAG: acetyltransferase [Chloroflexota bacterium]